MRASQPAKMPADRVRARMEELGHQFFVYVDAETERVHILYRRRDGDYGLIEPIVAVLCRSFSCHCSLEPFDDN